MNFSTPSDLYKNKWTKISLLTLLAISLLANAYQIYNHFKFYSLALSFKSENKSLSHYLNRHEVFKLLPMDKKSIVFLGDSYTQNFDVTEFFNDINIKNRGIIGDRTDQLLEWLDEVTIYQPKKIFIQIGINDLLQGIPVDSTLKNTKKILSIIKQKCPQTKIYVQSLFPTNWEVYSTIHSVLPLVKSLNKQTEDYCNQSGIQWINLYDSFCDENKLRSYYDCGDRLHLNGNGYLKWKILIEPYVKD